MCFKVLLLSLDSITGAGGSACQVNSSAHKISVRCGRIHGRTPRTVAVGKYWTLHNVSTNTNCSIDHHGVYRYRLVAPAIPRRTAIPLVGYRTYYSI